MSNKLIEKIIEISKENGALKKENEILKKDNKALIEKIEAQKELNELVDTIDKLFNINEKEIGKKIKESKKEENMLIGQDDESMPMPIIKGTTKRNFFSRK